MIKRLGRTDNDALSFTIRDLAFVLKSVRSHSHYSKTLSKEIR